MSSDTRDCLLDAAEALFLERGFAATSLRSVASRAEANLAATNYHFGSKQGLFEAVIHRRLTPINEARLENLNILEASGEGEPIEIEEILHAFLEPLMNEAAINLAALVERIFSEPPAVTRSMLENEFGEIIERYAAALGKVLPDLPEEELHWRFHFLVGGMLQAIRLESPIGTPGVSGPEKFDQLITYASAGFRAPSASN